MKNFEMPASQEIQSMISFCQVMSSAPFYQKLGPGGVMAIYMTAREYDLPFMACLNGGLHTFDGKVTFSAIMVHALILKAGHKADMLFLDETRCQIKFTRGDRADDPTYEPLIYDYTIEQAHKAGYLKKSNWQTSPKDMLFSRCLTGGGRKHCPETFVGVLVAGELVGTDSDSHCAPLLPPAVSCSQAMISQEAPALQIEMQKAEGYDEFCQKIGLADRSSPTMCAYLMDIGKKSKKTEVEIINYAIKYEERFMKTYGDWKRKFFPDDEVEEAKEE